MKQLTDTRLRQRIYATMARSGITEKDEQKDMILQFTDGRTDSSKEMYQVEAYKLLDALAGDMPQHGHDGDRQRNTMRRKMIHYAHLLNWKLPDASADMARLNGWCSKYGKFHKPLNKHNQKELAELLTQFETAFKSYLK